MSRIKDFLKPNFQIDHLSNQLVIWLSFVIPFLFTLPVHSYEDDGTFVDGYFYVVNIPNGFGGYHTARDVILSAACSAAGDAAGLPPLTNQGSGGCVRVSGSTSAVGSVNIYSCTESWSPSSCGTYPDPAEPENCTEYADANPDGVDATISGYQGEFCVNGCNASFGGVAIKAADSDEWTGTALLSGGSCNGGYQDGLGAQEIIDFYAHDSELQNCYDSTGRLIGQISSGLSCPNLDICYDVSTGNPVGTTSQSTSCSTGVKYNDLDASVTNDVVASTDTETLNPDGSSVVIEETVTTQTGLDGSTVSSTDSTTTNKDSSGSVTSSETTRKEVFKTGSDYCEINPTDPLCKLVDNNTSASLSGNCDAPPTCNGDPVGCASVQIQWENYCSNKPASESDFEAWRSDSATVTKYGVDVDENGVLTSLGKGEIDVQNTLGLSSLGDTGAAGSCPNPIDLGLLGAVIPFSFDTICDYATTARPLVIFASLYLCMLMVRRSLIGA